MTNSFEILLSLLDPNDRDAAGNEYELLRLKLVKYFEWRNCDNCFELADTVFERLLKRIDAGEKIKNLPAFTFGIANFVRLEHYRDPSKHQLPIEEDTDRAEFAETTASDQKEQRLDCLEKCLAEMNVEDRRLIIRYHNDDKRRRSEVRSEIAEEMGISLNTLRIRTCRIRTALENCIRGCCN